jgi:hypothetical protein
VGYFGLQAGQCTKCETGMTTAFGGSLKCTVSLSAMSSSKHHIVGKDTFEETKEIRFAMRKTAFREKDGV